MMDAPLLEYIIDESAVGKIVLDEHGLVIGWNRWMAQHSKLSLERVRQRSPKDIFGDKTAPRLLRAIEDAFQGMSGILSHGFNPHPLPLVSEKGEPLHQRVSVRGLKHQGARYCLIEIFDVHYDADREKALKSRTRELKRQAGHDPLTGLPNRELFADYHARAHAQARRRRATYAILAMDVVNLDEVNRSIGRREGEAMLKAVAEALAATLRAGDVIASFGGSSFGVLVDVHADPRHGAVVAEKIIEGVTRSIHVGRHELLPQVNIGIATYPKCGDTTQELLQHADAALIRAKSEGPNHFHFYSSGMDRVAREQRGLEKDLMGALARDEFVLYFQPQIDLRTRRVVGAEVLIRWQHPERGLVPPGQFIPLANETGLILPIGEWVLRKALEHIARWEHQGRESLRVGVNISGRQFNESGVVEALVDQIQRSSIDPSKLELELTEETMISRESRGMEHLNRLRTMGVNIAVDDFGTGYSSLSYLKDFPLDTLKIDRGFIEKLGTHERDKIITRTIIELAHSLGMRVIAEGVEYDTQLPFLADLACDEVQGYYFAKPQPAEDFWETTQRINSNKNA